MFRKTARNHNPAIATAGRITIAEVEEIVPLGSLAPDEIHTPGIYVQRVVQGEVRSSESRSDEMSRPSDVISNIINTSSFTTTLFARRSALG